MPTDTTLADQINEAHLAVLAAERTAFDHALRAGELLIEAKRTVGHGHFGEWIRENCRFGVRVAQEYMLLWRASHDGRRVRRQRVGAAQRQHDGEV